MFEFCGFLNERKLCFLKRRKGSKSEFGFDTVATGSRSKAKRMFELLDPFLLLRAHLDLAENYKTQTGGL